MDSCDSWSPKDLSPETLPSLALILPAIAGEPAVGFSGEVDGDGFSSCLSDDTFPRVESTTVSCSVSPAISSHMVASPSSSISYPGFSKPVGEEAASSNAAHESISCRTVAGAKRAKVDLFGETWKVLSSPYMKANLMNKEDPVVGLDLRSRGLCLVPISCTAGVANSNGADYWISGIRGCSQ